MTDPANDGIADPMTELAEGAATLHELHLSFVAAGFAEHQALYLIGVVLQSQMPGARGPEAP